MATGEARRLERRPALDGLRGVAALVVVVHHVVLLSPVFIGPDLPRPGTLGWLVMSSPLRLLWAGDVAVTVFFVLSGYVLARPYLAGRGTSWRVYYPKRLARLYLPVCAIVVLATLLAVLVPRETHSGRSWWVDVQAVHPSLVSIVRNATLWQTTDGLDNVLWSLRWEVLFSLLLPVFVAGAIWLRRFPAAVVLAGLLLMHWAGWRAGGDPLRYLPVFAVGVLLADREPALVARTRRWGRGRWWLLAVGAVALVTSTSGATLDTGPFQAHTLPALGAGLAVFLFIAWRPAAALMARPPLVWLGKVSYSLYLVHLPIGFALATLLPSWGVLPLLPLTVAASLLAAAAFHRYVEAPSQRFAASIGKLPQYDRYPSPSADHA